VRVCARLECPSVPSEAVHARVSKAYGAGRKLAQNDIVGSVYDAKSGTIEFFVNGRALGIAHDRVPRADELAASGTAMYPCVSLAAGQVVRLAFGAAPFAHAPLGCLPLHSNTGPAGFDAASALFDAYRLKGVARGDAGDSDDTLQPEGVAALCEDAGIDIDGVGFWHLSYVCNALVPFELTRVQFVFGCDALGYVRVRACVRAHARF
jgi:hypothetical protein